MRQRSRCIFRRRRAMHKSSWAKRGFTRVTYVSEQCRAFDQGHRVIGRQFHEQVVRMLSINDRLTLVSLACLKQQRRASPGKSERLKTEHSPQLTRSSTNSTKCGGHEPVC